MRSRAQFDQTMHSVCGIGHSLRGQLLAFIHCGGRRFKPDVNSLVDGGRRAPVVAASLAEQFSRKMGPREHHHLAGHPRVADDQPTQQEAAALVKLLEALGHELRLPQSRLLGNGLFELRDVGTGVRLFYVLLPGNRAALLDGMTKKRDDIPDATMKRLRALQGAVYAEFKTPKKGR